eukprot:156790-Chlamydomonas_euryale.AAC.1
MQTQRCGGLCGGGGGRGGLKPKPYGGYVWECVQCAALLRAPGNVSSAQPFCVRPGMCPVRSPSACAGTC